MNEQEFSVRGASSRFIAWATFLTAATAAILTVATVPFPLALGLLGFPAALAATGWVVYYRPRVDVSYAGLEFHNVARTVSIAWPAVESFDVRFGLTVNTRLGTRVSAWALPGTSARVERGNTAGKARVNRTLSAPVQQVLDYHLKLKDAGYLDSSAVPEGAIYAHFRWLELSVIAVALAWLAIAFAVLE